MVAFLYCFVLVLGFVGRLSPRISRRPATPAPDERISSPGGGIAVEHSGIEMSGMFLHIVCLFFFAFVVLGFGFHLVLV